LLLATDFSDASRTALLAARALFPECRATLVHGYAIPFSGVMMNDAVRDDFRRMGEEARTHFVESLPEAARAFDRVCVEQGDPITLLRDLSERQPDALIVAGSHGASGLLRTLLGTTARRIVDEVEADVLLVPDARRRE
jgi:nucleotide-binding universal stress UspA family protein